MIVEQTKQKSLINTCIERSKVIIISQAAKLVANELQFFMNRLPYVDSEEGLKNLLSTIDIRIIKEYKRSIAKLLSPQFMNIGINPVPEEFWFSSKDLQNGYVFLYKTFSKIPSHVLFLSKVDNNVSDIIEAGDIINYYKISHVLGKHKIHGVIEEGDISYRFSIKKLKLRNNEQSRS